MLVGIHDIFLPDDYPPQWADRFYSEQYLLAAWLLGGGGGCEIVLPAHFIRSVPELDSICDPIWEAPAPRGGRSATAARSGCAPASAGCGPGQDLNGWMTTASQRSRPTDRRTRAPLLAISSSDG